MTVINESAQFNLNLRRCETIEACSDLFRSAIARYGFDTFACGELDLQRKERHAFFVIDWPEAWRRFYLDNGIMERDPVVGALSVYREPFTWTDMATDQKLSRDAHEVIGLARSHGWTEGLVIPIPRGTKDRFGLVSLAGKGPHSIARRAPLFP